MRLKEIKNRRNIEKVQTKYFYKLMGLIKKECNIPKDELMFCLGIYYFGFVFLSVGKIFVAVPNFFLMKTENL